MNVVELKGELDKLGVPHGFYSINGDLTGDTHILNYVHTYWEYFYFDEKGRESGYRRFEKEHDACMYLYQTLADSMKYDSPSK